MPGKLSNAAQMELVPTQFLTEILLSALYIRLLPPNRDIRRTLDVTVGLAFCLYRVNISVHSYFGDPYPGRDWSLDKNHTCAPTYLLEPILGSLEVALDIFIAVAPIAVIVGLKMSRNWKIGILIVFLAGVM